MATRIDPQSVPVRFDRAEAYVEALDKHARSLWVLSILSYVGGDVITTFVGLQYTPLEEVGPLPAYLLVEFGFGALAGMKLGILVVFIAVWRLLPRPVSAGVPLGLAFVGSLITLWNGALIVFVVA